MKVLLALAIGMSLLAATAEAPHAGRTQLQLPYDLESRGRTVYVADGLRHQILRFDLETRRLTVVAGTGRAGFSGDGGAATKAQLDEVVGVALDRAGNLYAADLGNGRIRRIAPDGAISTVARVAAAAAVAVDPDNRYLAIASLENAVYLLDLRTSKLTRFAHADNPHGLAYDRVGNLLVAEQSGLRRFDAKSGKSTVVLRAQIFKVHVAPSGAVYVLSGSPSGGAVDRLVGGRAVRVVGTGGLTTYRATQPALRAGVLPADLEVLADGTILLSQSKPVAAICRLAGGRLVTVVR
ncbi:MAG: SMP-30/gluconolactonase/LRE family protein [Gaiellaceae bacterium]